MFFTIRYGFSFAQTHAFDCILMDLQLRSIVRAATISRIKFKISGCSIMAAGAG
jgi:hypothetical protein